MQKWLEHFDEVQDEAGMTQLKNIPIKGEQTKKKKIRIISGKSNKEV